MSTETETTTGQPDDGYEELPERARDRLRQLEKDQKEWNSTKAENEALKFEKSLRDAGLNLSNKQLAATLAAHEGEKTPDAIRKTAEELKFVEPVTETPNEEQHKHEQVQGASSGATQKTELSPEDAYAQANTPEEVMAIARQRGTPIADDMQ